MISSGMDTSSSSSELQDLHIEATPSLTPGLELEDPRKSAIILEADDDVSPPNFTYTSCFWYVQSVCCVISQYLSEGWVWLWYDEIQAMGLKLVHDNLDDSQIMRGIAGICGSLDLGIF